MMIEEQPTLLALDFDGVLCDGLVEYFQTAWRAYCQLWQPSDPTPPDWIIPKFNALRPVVETGWEMPVLIRSLLIGIPETELFANWAAIAVQQAQDAGLTPTQISVQVDHIRDEWIAKDLDDWLTQHRFYPGVLERLRQIQGSSVYTVIITTKEGRFVRQLLQQGQIDLPESQIFGKEVKQPKTQTLQDLLHQFNQPTGDRANIWFIEDRLKTLQAVQSQPDLNSIKLFLADWGYNTASDRETADQDTRIHRLSLATFAQDFSVWC